MFRPSAIALLALLLSWSAGAQDPTGTIEGRVTDHSAAALPGAMVVATHLDTGIARETVTGEDGFFRVPLLPVGRYRVRVEAPQFAPAVRAPVAVSVSDTVRVLVQLELASVAETVTVEAGGSLVESTSNVLGRVVTGRELVDLPLNGRNFTQLGLLQTGVAPLTAGVATAGGTLRQGQAYAVNGMRPEQNAYLVDGGQNNNRMDGGYALRLPVDAIAEFRILSQSAPPEYGGTAGATTSVVTRSGGNQFHGSLYEFLRNDVFDARNFFSRDVEPLNQHQFGGTIGGPIRRSRMFFFGYYEGFRNKQGVTTTATVPTPAERTGDFSGLGVPLLNLAGGGVPFPGNRIPEAAIQPIARTIVGLYPEGNVSPSIYRETLVGENTLDQTGIRLDYHLSDRDQLFARYSYSGGHNLNPISVRGTDVPGYPTRDDIGTHSAVVSATRVVSPTLTHTFRATYLRYRFYFDQRLGQRLPSDHAHQPGQLVVSRGAGEPVSTILGGHRHARVLLVLQVHRLPVVDESLGRRGQTSSGRERPGAEPLRSRRRARAIAVPRPPSDRGQRDVGASPARRYPGRPGCLPARLAGQRRRGAQLGDAVHGV